MPRIFQIVLNNFSPADPGFNPSHGNSGADKTRNLERRSGIQGGRLSDKKRRSREENIPGISRAVAA
ncbi:hypothetical protein J6590_011705 [Homalodisca vitripennis]|nr:hypothetical protein J6590_011705 [Homalodisca vitripennis]